MIRRTTVTTAMIAVALLFGVGNASAQFGKNKVTYVTLDWRMFETEHFRVFLPHEGFGGDEGLQRWASDIAVMAERGYGAGRELFEVDFSETANLVIYPHHASFEQSNVGGIGFIPEGIAAFATPLTRTIAFSLGSAKAELQQVLTHEIAHLFEYEFFWRYELTRMMRTNAPGIVMEGLAQYVAGRATTQDKMLVAALVHNDVTPSLIQMAYGGGYLVDYVLGPVVWQMVESYWGREGVRSILVGLRQSGQWNVPNTFQRELNVTLGEFDAMFRDYLREMYLPLVLASDDVSEIADEVISREEEATFPRQFRGYRGTQGLLLFSPVASSDGSRIAVFAVDWRRYDIDVVILNGDGTFLRNLTEGYPSGYDYPIAQGLTVAAIAGSDVAFSPDGRLLAFVVRTEPYRSIVIVDVETGTTVRRRAFPKFATSLLSPAFSPDGKAIVFSAASEIQSDIWRWSLEDDVVVNLTLDEAWDYAPVWADASTLFYVSVVEGYKKIFVLDRVNGEKRQGTFGQTNETEIVVSPASGRLLVVSDRGGRTNVYQWDRHEGTFAQLTDLASGAWSPSVVAGAAGEELLFVSSDSREVMFRGAIPEPVAVTPVSAFGQALTSTGTVLTPLLPPDAIGKAQTKYEFMMGPIFGGYSSFAGGMILSDISFYFVESPFGNHAHGVSIRSYGRLSSYQYSYRDISRRWGWGVGAWRYRVNGIAFDPFEKEFERRVLYEDDGVSVGTVYPFSKQRRFEFEVAAGRRDYNFSSFAAVHPAVAQRFSSGPLATVRSSFVNDTLHYREFGPYEGWQARADFTQSIPAGESWLAFSDAAFEVRRYTPITPRSLVAARIRAFASFGDDSQTRFFGGLDQIRGYRFWEFSGSRGGYANLEYRFPLLYSSSGPIRGVAFLDLAGGWYGDELENGSGFFGPKGLQYSYGAGVQVPVFGIPWPVGIVYVWPSGRSGRVDVVIGATW